MDRLILLNGRLHRLVTAADIGRGFGDQPNRQVFLRLLRLAARHGRTTLACLTEPLVEEPAPP